MIKKKLLSTILIFLPCIDLCMDRPTGAGVSLFDLAANTIAPNTSELQFSTKRRGSSAADYEIEMWLNGKILGFATINHDTNQIIFDFPDNVEEAYKAELIIRAIKSIDKTRETKTICDIQSPDISIFAKIGGKLLGKGEEDSYLWEYNFERDGDPRENYETNKNRELDNRSISFEIRPSSDQPGYEYARVYEGFVLKYELLLRKFILRQKSL